MKFDNFFAELKRRNAYKVAVACAVGAILAATVAYADEITVVTNVLGPEGPLFLDGNLYYVGWVSNTLSKWDGKAYPVKGNLPYNSVAYRVVNDRTNDITAMKDGKIGWRGRITVAPDGKSRTVTINGTDAQGKKFKAKVVYDKA